MITPRNYGMSVVQFGVAVVLAMASVADAAVTLDARLSQESYARLEPIFLTITLKNETDGDLSLAYPKMSGNLKVTIVREDGGQPVEYCGEEAGPRESLFSMPAGSVRIYVINLLEYYDLMQAGGNYKLSVRYDPRPRADRARDGAATEVWEKDLSFNVRRPTYPGTEAEVNEALAIHFLRPDLRADSQRKTVYPRDYVNGAAVIGLLYQDTVYYKYSYYYMAYAMSGGRLSTYNKAYDPEKTLQCIEKELEVYPEFPLREEMLFWKVLVGAQLKKQDPAAELQALLTKTTDLEVRRQIEQKLEARSTPK